MAVTTGKVRLSYCHIWQPQVPQSGGDAKYSVTILIPKSDVNTLNAIYAEMESTKRTGISSAWGGTLPPIVKIPLYDGDGVRPSGEPFGEECKGHMVITASAKNQPSVVDLNVQPILNQSDLYSGCYARASINFFAYNQAGNKGLGCGLNSIQKVSDGEPLAGGVSAQEAFGGNNAYSGAGTQTPAQGYQQPAVYQAPQQAYQVPQAAPPQPMYQQPQQTYTPPQQMSPPVYQAPQQTYAQQPAAQGVDPITGQPLVGGIMGMG